jgi:uncharacterized protein YecT (DUF1311 family)
MIKSILFATLVAWSWPSAGFIQQLPAQDPCADAMTTIEMHECLNEQFRKADADLNAAYKEVMAQLSESRQAKLREAQKAWIVFRERNAEFAASAEEGGTLAPLTHMLTMAEMTEERVAQLKDILNQFELR